jgi:hypothetical protein
MLAPVAAYADGDADRQSGNFVGLRGHDKIKTKLAAEHPAARSTSASTPTAMASSGCPHREQPEEVNKAVAIAKNTEGVKMVKSDLKVQKDR